MEQRRGAAVEQRRGVAVEQRILQRSAVDGGVIDVDSGRWRDRRRWWTVT